MLNRLVSTSRDFARQKATQSAELAILARDTLNGFITTAHHALMILGLSAIAALSLMFFKPDIADQLKALSPFSATATQQEPEAPASQLSSLMDMPAKPLAETDSPKQAALASVDKKLIGTAREQQRVTNWLAKRYRVANDATNMLVSAAYLTATETKLDPLLILSVMAIESGFNPFAESAVGAQGLMQVMSKIHHDKFEDLGGIKAALNPVANIKVGSLILKDYVTRGGSVEAGLKMYVGAAAFDNDSGYGSKVLAEYRRLKDVANGKIVPTINVAPPATKPLQAERSVDERKADVAPSAESAALEPKFQRQISKTEQVAAL